MEPPRNLDYATPPWTKRRVHLAIRVLFGIAAFFFLMPTINIVLGYDITDGLLSKAIGIIVTLTIAFYLAYVSFTGRYGFSRTTSDKGFGGA